MKVYCKHKFKAFYSIADIIYCSKISIQHIWTWRFHSRNMWNLVSIHLGNIFFNVSPFSFNEWNTTQMRAHLMKDCQSHHKYLALALSMGMLKIRAFIQVRYSIIGNMFHHEKHNQASVARCAIKVWCQQVIFKPPSDLEPCDKC